MLARPFYATSAWVVIAEQGGTMERINLPFFYELGFKLHALALLRTDTIKNAVLFPCYDVRPSLEVLLRDFPALTICRSKGQMLLSEVSTFFDTAVASGDWDKPLKQPEQFQAANIQRHAAEFETVLIAELENLSTYHVTQKAIYSTPSLIAEAEKMLPESTRSKMFPKAINELRETGRCLAFDNTTASGFHVMRATELVMHEYYVVVCKPETKNRLDNWGQYLSALDKCSDPDVKKIAGLLRQIKDQDRNLIMHPQVVLTSDEALNLLTQAKGIITSMADRLPELKKEIAKSAESTPVPEAK